MSKLWNGKSPKKAESPWSFILLSPIARPKWIIVNLIELLKSLSKLDLLSLLWFTSAFCRLLIAADQMIGAPSRGREENKFESRKKVQKVRMKRGEREVFNDCLDSLLGPTHLPENPKLSEFSWLTRRRWKGLRGSLSRFYAFHCPSKVQTEKLNLKKPSLTVEVGEQPEELFRLSWCVYFLTGGWEDDVEERTLSVALRGMSEDFMNLFFEILCTLENWKTLKKSEKCQDKRLKAPLNRKLFFFRILQIIYLVLRRTKKKYSKNFRMLGLGSKIIIWSNSWNEH